MPGLTDIEADLKIANAEVEQLRAEVAKLRDAISRYCHNDCYRGSCEGNEDVGIPDCPLARYAPLPSAPKKG